MRNFTGRAAAIVLVSVLIAAPGCKRKTVPTYSGESGYLEESSNCKQITGWAWDKAHPDQPVEVEILDGLKVIATLPADAFRSDLAAAGVGTGKHSFVYPTPPRLRDGATHQIRVRIAGTSTYLSGSPMKMACNGFTRRI
jgi:hypothetical protein